MSKYNYVFDNEENIYKFVAEAIQIARVAVRLGIDLDEYTSDMFDGGYMNPDFIPFGEEEYARKALASLMDAAVEKYMVRVVNYT